MEGVDSAHQILNVEGRRDGNMGSREGILERPEPVSLLMGEVSGTVWGEVPVGQWFLREQEGMGGKRWPEEGRSLLCDRGKHAFILLQELMVLICIAVRSWGRRPGKS